MVRQNTRARGVGTVVEYVVAQVRGILQRCWKLHNSRAGVRSRKGDYSENSQVQRERKVSKIAKTELHKTEVSRK